ncbi:MAG: T9SS type A sorting domain-containing protein [Bacteroidia bacterium]|nr:T9SS type A sorting domain-containing protein [Bacteroidia bacterium]MDW8302432.1 T9SS type A sorting domain-containing protein [Bacteroidia bacterium]
MKSQSYWIIILTAILSKLSPGQITIMPSDMPSIGVTYQMLQDTNTSLPVITPSSSTAQNWDYSNAFPNVTDTLVWQFVDKTTLPGHTNFPASTMGFNNKRDSVYVFLLNDNDGLYVEGTYTYFSLAPNTAIVLNPKELLFPTNFTYSNYRSHQAKSTVFANVMGFDVKLVSRITSKFTGDAFGSLKTPTGNYANVLRIKKVRIQQDSIYVKFGTSYVPFQNNTDSTLTYIFMEKNPSHALVCEIVMDRDNFNKPKRGRYSRTSSVSIKPEKDNIPQIIAYPNPVQTYLNLDLTHLPQAQNLILYDFSGKVLLQESVQSVQSISIDIAHLPKGIYTYHVTGRNNELLGWGKCVK